MQGALRFALAALLPLLAAGVAAAQEVPVARTFDQLQLLVARNATLTVINDAGRETRGKLLELTSSMLVLRVDGQPLELSRNDIRTIRQRRDDSLANGALIGFVAGAAIGGAFGAVVAEDEDAAAQIVLLSIGFYGGLGAGIGVGIDALIRRQHVIYERPVAGVTGLRLSPLLGRERRGVLVEWRF
jgi:hypothetical protein